MRAAELSDAIQSSAALPTELAPDTGGFFPPVQYSPVWMIAAVALVLLVIGFYVAVPLLTRARNAPVPAADTEWMFVLQPGPLREKYTALIGEVESAHARGEMGPREAHQRLSALLRFFAFEASGIRAPQMTLADLRRTRAAPLAAAIEKLYPTEFGRDEPGQRMPGPAPSTPGGPVGPVGPLGPVGRGDVREASAMARRVVDSWD